MLFRAAQEMWYIHVSAMGITTGASERQMSHTQLGSPEELERAW